VNGCGFRVFASIAGLDRNLGMALLVPCQPGYYWPRAPQAGWGERVASNRRQVGFNRLRIGNAEMSEPCRDVGSWSFSEGEPPEHDSGWRGLDPKFPHSGPEGGTVQAEKLSGTERSSQDASGLFQGFEDVLALDFLQCVKCVG
jgi:hypothetical protein